MSIPVYYRFFGCAITRIQEVTYVDHNSQTSLNGSGTAGYSLPVVAHTLTGPYTSLIAQLREIDQTIINPVFLTKIVEADGQISQVVITNDNSFMGLIRTQPMLVYSGVRFVIFNSEGDVEESLRAASLGVGVGMVAAKASEQAEGYTPESSTTVCSSYYV